jgi:hypothetical protein
MIMAPHHGSPHSPKMPWIEKTLNVLQAWSDLAQRVTQTHASLQPGLAGDPEFDRMRDEIRGIRK